jgi:hypothetical protein
MIEYDLIPMTDIDDEARDIAVIWAAHVNLKWIGDKHKLASDIMNYANKQVKKTLKEEVSWDEAFDEYSKDRGKTTHFVSWVKDNYTLIRK